MALDLLLSTLCVLVTLLALAAAQAAATLLHRRHVRVRAHRVDLPRT